MELTVSKLEEKLREFSKDTIISVGCNCCNHSSSGENVIKISNKTDQTYGYIELTLNDISKSEVELSKNKEEYYKVVIEKMQGIINEQDEKLKKYKNFVDDIINDSKWLE